MVVFATAFVSGAAVAFAILPLGLGASWAVPVAVLCGTLASGLAAWLVSGWGHVRLLAPVLASSLASLVLAIPLALALLFTVGTNLLITTPIIFFVVAAASTFASRRFGGSRSPVEGRAGLAKIVRALAALGVLVVLLLPVVEFGYTRLTACTGEERAVFDEFPQYAPRAPEDLDPKPDDPDVLSAFGSACVVSYSTPDAATQVIAYFEGRLRQNGWEVLPSGTDGAAVYARRGGYEYRVSFSGNPARTPKGTPVSVVVWKPHRP